MMERARDMGELRSISITEKRTQLKGGCTLISKRKEKH